MDRLLEKWLAPFAPYAQPGAHAKLIADVKKLRAKRRKKSKRKR